MIRQMSGAAIVPLVTAAVLLGAPASILAQIPVSGGQQSARVNETAPVYLLPDASRTPLRTLAAGTTASVDRVQGDWVQITFNDPQLGRRTGWIEAKFVTLGPPPAQPPSARPPQQGARPPAAPSQARRPAPPVRRPPPGPSVRGFGTFGYDKMLAADSFRAITGSDATLAYGGGVQGINLWRGLFAEVNVERSTVDGERAFVLNDEVFPLGVPLEIKMTPIDVIGGWRVSAGSRTAYASYVGAGITSVSYKETADFSDADDDVDERRTGFVALFGLEVSVSKWVHVRAEGRYRRVTDILGEGGVSAAFDEHELGGFGGGIKLVFGK